MKKGSKAQGLNGTKEKKDRVMGRWGDRERGRNGEGVRGEKTHY